LLDNIPTIQDAYNGYDFEDLDQPKGKSDIFDTSKDKIKSGKAKKISDHGDFQDIGFNQKQPTNDEEEITEEQQIKEIEEQF
jgi:hypothetical protein